MKLKIIALLVVVILASAKEAVGLTKFLASGQSPETFLLKDGDGFYVFTYNGESERYLLNFSSPEKAVFISQDDKKTIEISKDETRLKIVKKKKEKTKTLYINFESKWKRFSYEFCDYDGKRREGRGKVVLRNEVKEEWYLGRVFLIFGKITLVFSYSDGKWVSFDVKKQVF